MTNDFAIKDAVWLDGLAFVHSGEYKSRLQAIANRIRSDYALGRPAEVVEACATDGCPNFGTERFDSGGVGSVYCPECFEKIKALAPTENMSAKGLTRDDIAEIISKAGAPPGPPDGPISAAPDGHFLKVQAYKQADAVLTALAGGKTLPDDIRSFIYAIMGADTWVEAGMIWDKNPELRKATHTAIKERNV